jgi:chromosomal replication initiation ATPase DnaA
MKKDVPAMLCSVFIDRLEGDGTWDGMPKREKELHVQAFKDAHEAVFGRAGAHVVEAAKAMCEAIGIAHEIVTGPGRSVGQIRARRVLSYALREFLPATPSFPEIASATGRTNHSSVINSWQAARVMVAEQDPVFMAMLEKCKQAVQVEVAA